MQQQFSIGARVSVALLHYPVYNKNGEIVATAVTNLDLHDIARAACTYGLHRYYIVTPVADQQALAMRIAQHWQHGWGATYNPKRKAALDLVKVVGSLDDAVADIAVGSDSGSVKVIATGARERAGSISCLKLRQQVEETDDSYLVLLGTGWGLTEEVFGRADSVISPIRGAGEYNHLSVRSAAAIIFDRLLGER